MSAAEDRARNAGFINETDIVKAASAAGVGPGIYITFRAAHSVIPSAWQVHRPGYKTGPKDGFWADFGNKTFGCTPADRAERKDAACAWAGQRYAVSEWATIPGFRNSCFPAEVAAWAKAQIKTANGGR